MQNQLARGQRLHELLKQSQSAPLTVEEQIITIYTGTNGYLDSLEIEQSIKNDHQMTIHLLYFHEIEENRFMERKWFNSMLFNRDLEYRCDLSKSIDSFDPIENNGVNEDPSILTDMDNDIHSWKNNSENDSYNHGDYLVDVSNIQNFLSDKTFLVRDSNRNSYSIDFAIENQILEIDNNHSFFNEPESFFASYQNYSYMTNVSKSNDPNYIDDTQCNWIKNINSWIESYLCYQICIASYILNDSDNYNANINDLNSYISDDTNDSDLYQIENSNDTHDSDLYQIENSNDTNDSDLYQIKNSNDTNDSDFTPIENSNDTNDSDFTPIENSNDTNDSDFTPIEYSNDTNNSKFTPIQYVDDPKDTSYTQQLKHLWVQCESCFGLNYKKFF
ncbi:hypothetical protein RYX36_018229 [Vicia faba]